jgi:hypothetical protein
MGEIIDIDRERERRRRAALDRVMTLGRLIGLGQATIPQLVDAMRAHVALASASSSDALPP